MTHPVRFGAICRCSQCRAERAATWAAASHQTQNLLQGLAYGPRTWRDLSANQHVHYATVRSAMRAKLVTTQPVRVGPLISSPLHDFFALTREGEAVLHTAPPHQRKAA